MELKEKRPATADPITHVKDTKKYFIGIQRDTAKIEIFRLGLKAPDEYHTLPYVGDYFQMKSKKEWLKKHPEILQKYTDL